jgi:hypothetical protein
MLSIQAMRSLFTHRAAIGRPGRSTTLRAASWATPAGRCKSAPVTRRLRLALQAAPHPDMLVAPRQDMLEARLQAAGRCMPAARRLVIRSPPACSASGHTIRKPEPIWAMMGSAIPVHEPRCIHSAAIYRAVSGPPFAFNCYSRSQSRNSQSSRKCADFQTFLGEARAGRGRRGEKATHAKHRRPGRSPRPPQVYRWTPPSRSQDGGGHDPEASGGRGRSSHHRRQHRAYRLQYTQHCCHISVDRLSGCRRLPSCWCLRR